jgi:hypothetical protein
VSTVENNGLMWYIYKLFTFIYRGFIYKYIHKCYIHIFTYIYNILYIYKYYTRALQVYTSNLQGIVQVIYRYIYNIYRPLTVPLVVIFQLINYDIFFISEKLRVFHNKKRYKLIIRTATKWNNFVNDQWFTFFNISLI